MKERRVNLASGDTLFAAGWVNVDVRGIERKKKECVFVRADLTKPLPFKSGSVDVIYTSHFVEHLEPFVQCRVFLGECYRILKREGVLRVSVPDFKKIASLYLSSPKEYFAEYNYSKPWFNGVKTWARRMGISVMHDHKMLYDIESLAEVLGEAGFAEIVEVEPGEEGILTEKQVNGIVATHIGHSVVVDGKKKSGK